MGFGFAVFFCYHIFTLLCFYLTEAILILAFFTDIASQIVIKMRNAKNNCPDRKPVCSETFNLLRVSAGTGLSKQISLFIIRIADLTGGSMKNKIGFIIIILLLTIPFLAWSSASFEITPDIDTLVPEDALVYFQISNPENFMESIDSFLITTGLNEMMGRMPLQDFITILLASEEADFSLEYFDLSKSVGFAILPSTKEYAEKDDVDFMLFLPINTNMNILDLLKNKPEEEDFWYTIFMNYLVYFSSEDLKKNFPSNNISNLSHLDSYSNDSLSIYLDIDGLMKTFDIDTSDLLNELKEQDSSGSDLTSRIIEGYFNLFSQVKILYSNITLNRKGITFKSDLFFSDKIETIINSFQSVNNIKEWSSYLPEEGFIQSLYSMNSVDQKVILEKILDYLFPSSENDPIMSELKRNIGMFSDYMGNGGAFSIDFIPTITQETGIKKNHSSQKNTSDAGFPFGITINIVTDLTDPDGYLRVFRKYYSDQKINNIMDSLYRDLDFSLQITMEELNTNEISPVFRMTYQLQDRKTKSENSSSEMEPVKNFLNSMEFWYHISNDKMYSYMGPLGIEGIKKLIFADAPMKEWVSSSPDNANLIWNFSLSRIIESLGGIQGLEELLLLKNISFGMSGFSGFKDGAVHSSINIPAEDIMSIFQMIMEMGL